MSEFKLEIGDVWEDSNYEVVITEINTSLCKVLWRNKHNGSMDYQSTSLADLKRSYFFKGEIVTKPEDWFKTKGEK